jgi:hypothetical protein
MGMRSYYFNTFSKINYQNSDKQRHPFPTILVLLSHSRLVMSQKYELLLLFLQRLLN